MCFQTGTTDYNRKELTAENLLEGHKYVFRVAAENKVGQGPYGELKQAVLAKSQFGKFYTYCYFFNLGIFLSAPKIAKTVSI